MAEVQKEFCRVLQHGGCKDHQTALPIFNLCSTALVEVPGMLT